MASSSDTQLEELLNDVGNGKMQLPDGIMIIFAAFWQVCRKDIQWAL